MSYPPEHKHRTHARILESARRLFKEHGYQGVGIDTIMADAGLTRGGFYAHFKSKEDLFSEVVCDAVFTRHLKRFEDGNQHRPDDWLHRVVMEYLSELHRDREETGCLMAPLSADIARSGPAVQSQFAETIQALLAEIAGQLPDQADYRRERAIAVAALCVGGLALARAVGKTSLSGELLQACRVATDVIAAPSTRPV